MTSGFDGGLHDDERTEYIDPMTSETILQSLEERMRNWLEWDGSKHSARVAKLHRSAVEVTTTVPGLLRFNNKSICAQFTHHFSERNVAYKYLT